MNQKLLLLSSGIAALGCVSCSAKNDTPKVEKPNIVIIYADDMGYGDMSCQNPQSKIQTPNLDQLASEGMRFTDGHSSCGISSPSRYALLTGNYHWRRMNGIVNAFGESVFKENEVTMPRMLGEMGYQTAMVGKWHLGWNWDSVLTPEAKAKIANGTHTSYFSKEKNVSKYNIEDFDWSQALTGGPVSIGFDSYFGDGTINFPPYCWIENEHAVTAPTFLVSELNYKPLEGNAELREGPAAVDWHPTKVLPSITKRAVKVIKDHNGEKPLFLYCALSAPHAPIHPNEEFRGKSEAGAYGDFVVQCDDIVRQITQALREKGLEENTIVIFTADNGSEKYAFERIKNFDHNSTQSLRGVKRDMWEGGHRVPFIVKWPSHIKAGEVNPEPVSQVDFMATIAKLVGYELPNEAAVDSYDIMPTLRGEKFDHPLRKAIVHNSYKGKYSLRQGDWVLIDNNTGSHSKPTEFYLEKYGYTEYTPKEKSELLYNLKEDQAQTTDKAAEHPEMVAQMRALLKEYIESGRSVPQR